MACGQPLRDVATLMIETGMRPEEVCCIERRHVHPRRSTGSGRRNCSLVGIQLAHKHLRAADRLPVTR